VKTTKKWETQTESWFDEAGLTWSHSNKKLPCAVSTRYPDYLFVADQHCVLCEVDENEHHRYNARCEISRLSELQDSISCLNLHVIRYNPNAKGSTEARKQQLIEAIQDAIRTNFATFTDTGVVVQYLGYAADRIVYLDNLECSMQTEGLV